MELGHVLNSDQGRAILDEILATTAKVKNIFSLPYGRVCLQDALRHKTIVLLFSQPSTRTRTKFELAGKYLGADVVVVNEISSISAAKGESWRNTIKTYARLGADIIVIRHSQNLAPRQAAAFCDKYGLKTKIINAGDGNNLHPTQAFLDLFTIQEHFPKKFGTKPLEIAVGADLKNARALHSLVAALAEYPVRLTLISWNHHALPKPYLEPLLRNDRPYSETVAFPLGKRFDVVYWIRHQSEYEPERIREELRQRYCQEFSLDHISLQMILKDKGIFMHPGPRGQEIDDSIDSDPRVKDGDQVENGIYSSMALYLMMLAPNFKIPHRSILE